MRNSTHTLLLTEILIDSEILIVREIEYTLHFFANLLQIIVAGRPLDLVRECLQFVQQIAGNTEGELS